MIDLDSKNSLARDGQAIDDNGDIVFWINAGFGIDNDCLRSDGTMNDLYTMNGFGTSLAHINSKWQGISWS